MNTGTLVMVHEDAQVTNDKWAFYDADLPRGCGRRTTEKFDLSVHIFKVISASKNRALLASTNSEGSIGVPTKFVTPVKSAVQVLINCKWQKYSEDGDGDIVNQVRVIDYDDLSPSDVVLAWVQKGVVTSSTFNKRTTALLTLWISKGMDFQYPYGESAEFLSLNEFIAIVENPQVVADYNYSLTELLYTGHNDESPRDIEEMKNVFGKTYDFKALVNKQQNGGVNA